MTNSVMVLKDRPTIEKKQKFGRDGRGKKYIFVKLYSGNFRHNMTTRNGNLKGGTIEATLVRESASSLSQLQEQFLLLKSIRTDNREQRN